MLEEVVVETLCFLLLLLPVGEAGLPIHRELEVVAAPVGAAQPEGQETRPQQAPLKEIMVEATRVAEAVQVRLAHQAQVTEGLELPLL